MSERGPLVVLGAGGQGKVAIATARAAGWAVAAAYDDDSKLWGTRVLDVEVRGPLPAAADDALGPAVLAIGDNRQRRRLSALHDLDWATVVHPSATVHESSLLGAGTVAFAAVVVQPECEIGEHVILNTAASVDHDCRIEGFVHLAPGARLAGEVRVGRGALLGIGCAVIPGRAIGEWATVGAGCAVTADVAASEVVRPPGATAR